MFRLRFVFMMILIVSGLQVFAAPPTVSRATTFYTEPVDEEGYVDYVAALNADFGDPAIQPENNVYVGLLELADTSQWDSIYLTSLSKRLGVPLNKLNKNRLRLILFERFAKAHHLDPQAMDQQVDAAMQEGSWTDAQLPLLAQWLEQMNPVLDEAMRAIEREDYFAPLVMTEDDRLIYTIALPHLVHHDLVVRSFVIRSHHDLAQGNLDRPVATYLALRRLARLQRGEPVLVSNFVGISIDRLASRLCRTLLNRSDLTRAHVQHMVAGIAALPARATTHRALHRADRACALQAFQAVERGHPAISDEQRGKFDPLSLLEKVMVAQRFDMDRALGRVNAMFDDMPGDNPLLAYRELVDQIEAYEHRLDQSHDRDIDFMANLLVETLPHEDMPVPSAMSKLVGTSPLEDLSVEEVTDITVDLVLGPFNSNIGLLALRAERQGMAFDELTAIGLALAAYRFDHGAYPQALDALSPTYLDVIPVDFATGEPLKYRLQDGGYLLYSVGKDFEDDGGVDDPSQGDFVIQVGQTQTR